MVINETKEEFTLKLVDYYNSILMSYRDSSDKEFRDYVFKTLLRKKSLKIFFQQQPRFNL